MLAIGAAAAVSIGAAGCSDKKPALPAVPVANASALHVETPQAPGGSADTAASGDASMPPTSAHPCMLVTEAEATAALGVDPGAGVEVPADVTGLGTCVYGARSTVVRISLGTIGSKTVYDSLHNEYSTGGSEKPVDVPGVGNAAFEVTGGPSIATVLVLRDGKLVNLELAAGDGAPPKDKAIALATLAIGRV